ncbi:MAG: hypothetical protein GY719_17185 [bacterium]|nr:hypothetical protein [bacterium]
MSDLAPQPRTKDLRKLVSYSLLTGLCPLIPIPVLDDWARDLLRRRLVAGLVSDAGVDLGDFQVKVLACGYVPPTAGGCALGCLRLLVVKPLTFLIAVIFRKIMRKILFFLTIKDAVATFSRTFHEAYLLRHALGLGVLAEVPHTVPPAPIDPRLLAVRATVEAVSRATDTRPVTTLARSLFTGSRRLLMRTARAMTRLLRRGRRDDEERLGERLEREGEERLGGLIDELTADLEAQGGYLETLEARLEQRLVAPV